MSSIIHLEMGQNCSERDHTYMYIRVSHGIFVRKGKINHVKHTGPEGVGVCSSTKCSPSKVASGGFCGPRRLVAEMLLHFGLKSRGEGTTLLLCVGYVSLITFVFHYSYHNRLYLHYVSTLYQLLCY